MLPRELQPFAESLQEPALARTASDCLAWLKERAGAELVAGKRVPLLVTVSSVYARLSAPRLASERCYDVAARFMLLFFLVDDAALDELPQLLSERADWSIGPFTGALRSWLSELREQASVSPRLRARFADAYHDYLASRRAEHLHKTQPSSLAEDWAFRRRSIFMDPHLDMWLILLGVDLDEPDGQLFAEPRALAVDLVLLTNDLGSLERDRQGGASPEDLNLVHSYAREHRCSESEATESVIAEHNGIVERYRAALARALAKCAQPGAQRYAELLNGVVDGNRLSVLALGFRYPGAEALLGRLSRVCS